MLHGVGVRARQGWGERTRATAGPAGISLERSVARVASSLALLVVIRFTSIRSCALQLRRSVASGWLTFRTRACAFFPPAVVKRPADDLPFPGLVRDAVADPKLHRRDPCGGVRGRLGLLLGPGLSHPWSPTESSAVAQNAQ